MGTGGTLYRGDTFPDLRAFGLVEGGMLCQREAGGSAGQGKPDRPHAGVAAFFNAGLRVIDLDAATHVRHLQRQHVGQRHVGAGAPSRREIVASDNMVDFDAFGTRHGQQYIHDLARVAGTGADFQAARAQGSERLDGAGDRPGVGANLGNLHRHEALVDGVDIGVVRRSTEFFLPIRLDDRVGKQGLNMVALGQAHRAAGLGQGDGDAKGGEGIDKDLGGGEGAEIDEGAGPIENDGIEAVRHGVS